MKKVSYILFALLIVGAMVIAACQPLEPIAPPTETPAPTETLAPTDTPAPTNTPTPTFTPVPLDKRVAGQYAHGRNIQIRPGDKNIPIIVVQMSTDVNLLATMGGTGYDFLRLSPGSAGVAHGDAKIVELSAWDTAPPGIYEITVTVKVWFTDKSFTTFEKGFTVEVLSE